jgi:hypothetical protein
MKPKSERDHDTLVQPKPSTRIYDTSRETRARDLKNLERVQKQHPTKRVGK